MGVGREGVAREGVKREGIEGEGTKREAIASGRPRDALRPIRGHVAVYLGPGPGQSGRWALAAEADNLFVNVGYQQIATFLAGAGTPKPAYIAVGDVASPTIAAADTALGHETSRKAISSGGVVGGYTVRLGGYWMPAEAQGSITEVGLFVSSVGGAMLARAAVTTTKGNQPMNVIWQLQLPIAG